MSSLELENKKLREKIQKLTAFEENIKQLEGKTEYLEAISEEKDKTIYQLNDELNKIKKIEENATASLSTALKEVLNLKEKLEEQEKVKLQKDDELNRNIKDQDKVILNLKNDYESMCLKSQSALNDQKRETEEWKQKFETCQMLIKDKETDISKLTASFNIQSQTLQEDANAEINLLKTLLTDQENKYEEDAEDYKTEITNLKEQLKFVKEISEGLSFKLESEKNFFKQSSENNEKESAKQKLEIGQLKQDLSKAERDNIEKDETIKELKLTIKVNRDFLYTDSEFDLIVAKIKTLRSENKQLKLENLKLLEENDKITDDIVCLRRDLKDSEDENDIDELIKENRKLKEINESLAEEKEKLLKELISKTYNFN